MFKKLLHISIMSCATFIGLIGMEENMMKWGTDVFISCLTYDSNNNTIVYGGVNLDEANFVHYWIKEWDINTRKNTNLSKLKMKIGSITTSKENIYFCNIYNNTIYIYNRNTQKIVQKRLNLEHSTNIDSMSCDAKENLFASTWRGIYKYNLKNDSVKHKKERPTILNHIACSGDTIVHSFTDEHATYIQVLNNDKNWETIKHPFKDYIEAIGFSPNGKLFAACSNKLLVIWNCEEKSWKIKYERPIEKIVSKDKDEGYITSCALCANSQILLLFFRKSITPEQHIILYDFENNKSSSLYSKKGVNKNLI